MEIILKFLCVSLKILRNVISQSFESKVEDSTFYAIFQNQSRAKRFVKIICEFIKALLKLDFINSQNL